MICPYCGFDSKEPHCTRCKAMIFVEKPKEKPKGEHQEEHPAIRRKKEKE